MRKDEIEKSIKAVGGIPQNADEMLLKYGTYNIQPTADTHNLFPGIAQGLPKTEFNKGNKKQK